MWLSAAAAASDNLSLQNATSLVWMIGDETTEKVTSNEFKIKISSSGWANGDENDGDESLKSPFSLLGVSSKYKSRDYTIEQKFVNVNLNAVRMWSGKGRDRQSSEHADV